MSLINRVLVSCLATSLFLACGADPQSGTQRQAAEVMVGGAPQGVDGSGQVVPMAEPEPAGSEATAPGVGASEEGAGEEGAGEEGAAQAAPNEVVEPPPASEPPPAPEPQPPAPVLIEPAPTPEPPEAEACVTATATTTLPVVNLLVMLDTSGSMLFNDRWPAVTTSLKSFFADPMSAGLNASLNHFPNTLVEPPADFVWEGYCIEDAYEVSDVALTPLPNVSELPNFIDGLTPKNGSPTPTTTALNGVIRQAQATATAHPESRVALLLVTDGQPAARCGEVENNVRGSAAAVSAVATQFPTYVIGIGENLTQLNVVAQAGGTDGATLIEEQDPATLSQRFQTRLEEIRESIVACDAPFPEPPSQRTLDPTKVTTLVKWPTGDQAEISYDGDCSTGAGWSYDDPANPSTIHLCERTCRIMREQDATFEVVFGCTVNPQVPR